MTEKILKREPWIRIACLVIIAASVFMRDLNEKIILLIPGIAGLLLLAVLKKQKALVIIFILLLLIAVGGVFYANGEWDVNELFNTP